MRYFLALFLLFSPLAWAADGRDPKWQEYVVGELSDLPSGPVKKFLETSHHNNAHAADLRSLTRVLGPFSPDEHKVFWIPTIDVPLTPDNWRFLSQLDDLPDGVRENAIVREAGDTKIRMFLHPFTTEQPAFRKMAKRFGGFRFEHQGVTTASTRSFIAWPTERPKPEDGAGKLQFPRNRDRLFWPKVSIFSLDVEGSRLNPLKKMTRAATVTRALGGVPEATR
ncbi:MAG: hypothetical protein HUU37_07560, partial [Bdellovibrionales bacterium]|nr:hypothetical protein [Bdellovibrionales bacterium]